jgi:acyl transferase domain-containing protein/acyl carrier protein
MSDDVNSPIVVVGMACRVPGADSVDAFADLLFGGRTGYGELPADRCDRALYSDSQKGKVGKSYTTLGGTVPERPIDREVCPLSESDERLFDATHVQFAEVAATAWRNADLAPQDIRLKKTGVYVGHSGGTKSGGGLSLGTQIEEALKFVDDIEAFRQLPEVVRRKIIADVARAVQHDRPSRRRGALPSLDAYKAAALSAEILGLTGPRTVIDAACASSLVALAQAMLAIRAGRIDSAIVGGATYNNIDNLILFSHSQACTATDSRPFDDNASGLVSSEGYVAVVVMTQDMAIRNDLPILGVIRGVGMASDGKGRSLWAPRMEGQMLALQRGYSNSSPLDIDYLEAHATSTQLGDATELETIRRLAQSSPSPLQRHQLLIGSVKSNIGHTLEAAGLIGLVKVLIAMHRRQIPPSLRFEQPNRNYDWTTSPVRVVTHTEPWPERSLHKRLRRAAVSSFGIGGLNAHVVVEEAAGRTSLSEQATDEDQKASSARAHESIAIVGRGIIVAGAKNVEEFRTILESDRSALSDAPASRWRDRAGISASSSPETHRTPHCRGGFITDFKFDGSRYAIPPKQVQQANPVQLMLIDAVAQALAELNSADSSRATGSFPVDRQRVGVVIGTVFGGEFGDQLQVGMKLPEICQHMESSMMEHGATSQLARQVATEFRQIVLKNRPALLDETGSFTASTLASRIAKTFDLMGGACALDSDETSGLTALAVAADQLRSGICDMVICGSGQRSMSLSAFESLDMNGQLVRSGREEDVPEDCRQILPGEGVVALMLCRLSDAKRLDLPIHGILGDVVQANETEVRNSRPARKVATVTTAVNGRAGRVNTSSDAIIVRKIGFLAGTHSLVRITAETLGIRRISDVSQPSHSCKLGESVTIAAQTMDGIELQTTLSVPTVPTGAESFIETQSPSFLSPMIKHISPKINFAGTAIDGPLRRFRFAATSEATLLRLLKGFVDRLKAGGDTGGEASSLVIRDAERDDASPFSFDSRDLFRATILAETAEQVLHRVGCAIKAAEAGKFRTVLDRERVVLWQLQESAPRVAWLFPGQGSHYPEIPSVFSVSETAQRTLAKVDELYAASNLPKLSTAFDNAAIKPGADVWWAQAWVLGVSAALIEALKASGLHPDAVMGHSFGEFTASLAANVTTLPQAIELAKHRANAVMSHMRVPGGLLSIRAAVHEVDSILKTASLQVYVTHLNSTKQTVIAGSREGIAAAKLLLDKQGIASMSVSVPAPFHTPLLADAETAFERMSAGVLMRPPVYGFLSATSVQYLAEPSSIRNSLVRQLTQPVMFMPSIQRMMGEGFSLFLEVGPNDVLTRMNRDIVDQRALCLSLDVPGQPFEERMQLVKAALECIGSSFGTLHHSASLNKSVSSDGETQVAKKIRSAGSEDIVFDVTRNRRTTRSSTTQVYPDATTDRQVLTSQQDFADSDSIPQVIAGSHAAPSSVTDAELKSFVQDLVVELTGYSPEVVDFDADLEANLGIDSIKKAQILGELGIWLGMSIRPDGLRFDSVRTLDDAIRTVRKLVAKESPSAVGDSFVTENSGRQQTSALAKSVAAHPKMAVEHRGSLPANAQLDGLLIDYVVDQTGYTPEIVDLDADLEADLGLDSIKLAQLIGQMREQFNLESITLDSIGQNRFRTLREIREFLVRNAAGQPLNVSAEVAWTSGDSRKSQSSNASDHSHQPHGIRANPTTHTQDTGHQRITTLRGAEPTDEITPEWSEWFHAKHGQLSSPEFAMQAGIRQGDENRARIRSALRMLVNRSVNTAGGYNVSAAEAAHFAGIAMGAGVAESSVRFAAAIVRDRLHSTNKKSVVAPKQLLPLAVQDDAAPQSSPSQQTHRYALRVVPAPRRAGMPISPELQGAALILGANSLSEALADRIRQLGQQAIVLSADVQIAVLEKTLADLWQHTATPHLFLTMASDSDSVKTLTEFEWKRRRPAALEVPFRICQLWMQQTIDTEQMEKASVIAATKLGGDFGFSGQHVDSVEAIGGLVKAMLIESWMRGFRTTPMKVIDLATNMAPAVAAGGILQELAVPSYDMEIAFRGDRSAERLCVQAVPAPLHESASPRDGQQRIRISQGGTWIVSGGGRGITAVIGMTLAKKYNLNLHLIGTAPVPELSDEFVRRVCADRGSVRNRIMQEAQARGESPVEAWRNVEKSIEIDATLRDCRKQGIVATYYCCDVSNFSDVESVVRSIRNNSGPICGVIHGAGAGQDARFDRKRPDKVEKCLRAKIDGSFALMQATNSDPLEWFVTFGSISGRFGANGHTDYSLANDMMAKIVDRYRSQRPEVRSVTFHWHAWGDIGMATKPEARLALEMIDMEFMPARDGIAHFMRELEFGGDEPEVLITDESYFRKFFPAERLSTTASVSGVLPLPLLSATATQRSDDVFSSVVTLNPESDRFLSQHRVQNRPTLPFVVALELMAEAVRLRTGDSTAGTCVQAVAKQAIRFATDDPLAVTVQSRVTGDGLIECRLLADVRRRDGRMVEEDREYFSAAFDIRRGDSSATQLAHSSEKFEPELRWTRIEYGSPEGLIYHGPELQELREVADDGQTIYGRIAASAPVQLFGGSRTRGFTVPCSTMDACLYAIGYAAWHRHQKPSLPVKFGRIEFGRLPDPGEPCVVRIQQIELLTTGAVWDFDLSGHNGDRLLTVSDYHIGWLKGT